MTTFLVVLRPTTPESSERSLAVRADHLESQPNGSLILYDRRYGQTSVIAIFPLDTVVFAGDMGNIEIIEDEKTEKKNTKPSKTDMVPFTNHPG